MKGRISLLNYTATSLLFGKHKALKEPIKAWISMYSVLSRKIIDSRNLPVMENPQRMIDLRDSLGMCEWNIAQYAKVKMIWLQTDKVLQ